MITPSLHHPIAQAASPNQENLYELFLFHNRWSRFARRTAPFAWRY
ncbi:MAG TPA: hypothetical protein ACFE0H_09755 [Elainellaceae cyanobacterium]